ncbi:hypothetical protein T492DRAFT_1108492, partial [Pavlovales sp. CCMP2436]
QAPLAGPLAWCQLSAQGLRFTTEESLSLQARVYLMADLFREYEFAEAEPVVIGLNLGAVLECLRILDRKLGVMSMPPSLYIQYHEESSSLMLTLIEGIAHTMCEIATLDNGLPADHGSAGVRQKVVVMHVCVAEQSFKLTVRNADCGCEMDFKAEAISRFEADSDVRESYRFSHLQSVSRALHAAETACLRVMGDGELNVMMKLSDSSKNGFVEYFLAPLSDENDADVFG